MLLLPAVSEGIFLTVRRRPVSARLVVVATVGEEESVVYVPFRGKLCSWRIVVLLVDVVARVPRMNAQHERSCEIFNIDQRADENKKKDYREYTICLLYYTYIYIYTHRDRKRTRRDIQIVIQRIERERRRPKDRKSPSVCFS